MDKAASKGLEHEGEEVLEGQFQGTGEKIKKSFIARVRLCYAAVENHLKFSVV